MRNKLFKQRYAKREELSIILGNKIKEMRISLDRVNKGCYPDKKDFKGWELYGKMSALAWFKIMYIDGRTYVRWLEQLKQKEE